MHWSRQTFQQSRAERAAGGGGAGGMESGMGGGKPGGRRGGYRHALEPSYNSTIKSGEAGGGGGLGMHWSLQTFPQPRGRAAMAVRAARRLGMGNTMGLH